jgi:hypothetical protein
MSDLDSVSLDFAKKLNKAGKVPIKLYRNSVKYNTIRSLLNLTSSKSMKSIIKSRINLYNKKVMSHLRLERWKLMLLILMLS